ncbi:MAG: glycosyltransferase [Acidimicrobiales bacterium]
MSLPPVIVDLTGAQSVDHRDRGVARFVIEHAKAIEQLAPGLIHSFVLNPNLPPPGGIDALLGTGRVESAVVRPKPDAIVHLMSPFELSVPFNELLPLERRSQPLVVTLYDLIPEVLADRYLQDPGLRRRWRTRAELVRRADHVLAISASAGRDASERLHLSPERISVIGTGTAAIFRPPTDRQTARDHARRRVPGLAQRWVLYTGGTDERKNVERLLEAWALLAAGVKAEWQLVIACKVDDLQRNHLLVRADQLGFAGGLLVPGFVPDDLMVLLNQGADLAVFPSLYEGYGLPVAEALACGTPAVASNTSSLPEILPAEALFDPTDPAAIADAIAGGLRDPERRAVLESVTGRPPDTWAEVAQRTVRAYETVAAGHARRRPGPRRLPHRLAFVTPLPPSPTGIARFSREIVSSLTRIDGVEVEVYVDQPPHHRGTPPHPPAPSDGYRVRPLASLPTVENLRGQHDRVVYSLGNSEFHTGALAMLHRRPGVVLAHDVVLTNLWRFAQWQHPDAVPQGFQHALHEMYAGLPPQLGAAGRLSPEDVTEWGTPMARDVIARSDRFITTSTFAADWARIDARAEDRHKVATIPFPFPPPNPSAASGRHRHETIATFGIVDPTKQPELLIDAFSLLAADRRRARLIFVGTVDAELERSLRARAEDCADRVEFTGAVDYQTWTAYLHEAWVGVQLRSTTNGEASAAVADCLAAGLPTVVTALGAMLDVPSNAAMHVPAGLAADELAAVLSRLLDDKAQRAALAGAAVRHAADNSYSNAAAALYELLFS